MSVLVIVTAAPAIAAPDASVTVPRAEPTPVCAINVAEKLSASTNQVPNAANPILFTGTSMKANFKESGFCPSTFALLRGGPDI